MIRLSHKQIEDIRDEKQRFEVDVAKALYELFDGKEYKYLIQELVRRLVEHILECPGEKLNPWLVGQAKTLAIFKKGIVRSASATGLRRSLFEMSSWKLESCSDFIRLFGEFNEASKKWGEKDPRFSDYHFERQNKFRPGTAFLKKKDAKSIDDGGYGLDYYHRHRDEIDKADRVRRGAPYLDIPGGITRGVERYTLGDHSVIGAIDRTFGLKPEGGDISGTTTDSIYAMDWAASVVGRVSEEVLQAIQLLPLATMVYQGHHAILECAYPLSRWHYMDYHIGYYTTLTPIAPKNKGQATVRSFKAAQERVKAALAPFDAFVLNDRVKKAWEGRNRPNPVWGHRDRIRKVWRGNEHVLVWGRGDREAGALMEDQDEIKEFEKMAKVLNAYGFCLSEGLSDFNQARNIMQIYCPHLAVDLERLRNAPALPVI